MMQVLDYIKFNFKNDSGRDKRKGEYKWHSMSSQLDAMIYL